LDEHSRNTYAGEYYLADEWEKLAKVDFGPIQVSALEDGSDFVKRCYGENAMDYGFTLLNHRTFGIEFPRKYFLNKNHITSSGQRLCNPIQYDEHAFKSFSKPYIE